MPTRPSTAMASRSKTRLVVSSSDDSAGTGVARATGGRLRFCLAGNLFADYGAIPRPQGGPVHTDLSHAELIARYAETCRRTGSPATRLVACLPSLRGSF